MIVLDKYGYPIERVIGRPISNFMRFCLHGRGIIQEHVWSAYQKREIERGRNPNAGQDKALLKREQE